MQTDHGVLEETTCNGAGHAIDRACGRPLFGGR
jgi:hypothetical protein